jgi:hypothetical protein
VWTLDKAMLTWKFIVYETKSEGELKTEEDEKKAKEKVEAERWIAELEAKSKQWEEEGTLRNPKLEAEEEAEGNEEWEGRLGDGEREL